MSKLVKLSAFAAAACMTLGAASVWAQPTTPQGMAGTPGTPTATPTTPSATDTTRSTTRDATMNRDGTVNRDATLNRDGTLNRDRDPSTSTMDRSTTPGMSDSTMNRNADGTRMPRIDRN